MDYLKENLKDPSSYESVEFSKIDSLYSRIEDEPELKMIDTANRLLDKCDNLQLKVKMAYTYSLDEREEFQKEASLYIDSAKQLIKKVDEFKKAYDPYYIGPIVKHKYRAKNGFGGLDISEQTFLLSNGLDSVVSIIK